MWGNQGFENEDQGGGYFNTAEETPTASGKTGPKRAQNIVPAMIGQLLNSPEDLQLWGIDVQIVTIVGIVKKIESSTTKYTYDITDETGSIVAFRWLEADKPAHGPTIEVNTYVRVYGSHREQNQKKHILILRIEPLTDLNELTSHLLEVIFVNLKAEKLCDSAPLDSTLNTMETSTLPNSLMDSSISAAVAGMNNEQKVIYKIIQDDNKSPSGVHRNDIKSRVPQHMASRVDDILEFLASEGHIYTTLTDDHFKTT